MKSFTIWLLFSALISQQVFDLVASVKFEDEKTYYSPDPSSKTPPSVSYGSPPSHTPPSNCGSPPYDPPTSHTPSPKTPSHTPSPKTPSHTPSPKTPSHTPSPKTPSHTPSPKTPSVSHKPPCNCGTPSHVPTPSHPSRPSTPVVSTPPSTPVVSTPPSTPVVSTPPTPIVDPGTPGTPFVPAPFPPVTGTCDYWKSHPTVIWGLLGWWGTIGGAFGTVSTIPGFDPHMTLLEAVSNTRTDPMGSLCREGTASWLNSMVNKKFYYTTPQVKDHFVAGLSSIKAATKQAHTFKLANEGRLKI